MYVGDRARPVRDRYRTDVLEMAMSPVASPPKMEFSRRPYRTIGSSVVHWRTRSRSVRQVVRRVLRRVVDHECNEMAGEMAFDFAFSIFPAALFTAALIGLMGITPEFVTRMLDVLGILIPPMLRSLVDENIRYMVAASSQKLLTLGLVGALWAASSAISATMKALNRAYGVVETRGFFHRRSLSVGLLFGAGLATAVSFNLLILGHWIETHLLARLGIEDIIPSLLSTFKWPIGFLGAVVMAGLLYRIAPNSRPRLRDLVPGAVLFAILWFLLALGFGYYVRNFSYYNKVYGLLGVFIIFQLWIYLTALILLVGGELNSELAQSKRRAS